GIRVCGTKPGLVPLTSNLENSERFTDLAGVSTEVIASCNGQSFREKMLITHRGLSGPAILQISSYWGKSQSIKIDLVPDREVITRFLKTNTPLTPAAFKSVLQSFLPQRLAEKWSDIHMPISWTNTALKDAESEIHKWSFTPSGT